MSDEGDPVDKKDVVLLCEQKGTGLFFQLFSPFHVDCTPLLVGGCTGKCEHFPDFYIFGVRHPDQPFLRQVIDFLHDLDKLPSQESVLLSQAVNFFRKIVNPLSSVQQAHELAEWDKDVKIVLLLRRLCHY